MSGIYSSMDIGIESVVTHYKDLISLNPKHELLRLIKIKNNASFSVREESSKLFEEKYQKGEDANSLRGQSRTLIMLQKDLERAVKDELFKKLPKIRQDLEEFHPGIVKLIRLYGGL